MQWPPETSSVRNGKSTGSAAARRAISTCASRWCTATNGLACSSASAAFADSRRRAGRSRGPARRSPPPRRRRCHRREPRPLERLRRRAVERVGVRVRAPRRASRRQAPRGLRRQRLAEDGAARGTTATPVSSQLVSIPSTVNGLSCGGSPWTPRPTPAGGRGPTRRPWAGRRARATPARATTRASRRGGRPRAWRPRAGGGATRPAPSQEAQATLSSASSRFRWA